MGTNDNQSTKQNDAMFSAKRFLFIICLSSILCIIIGFVFGFLFGQNSNCTINDTNNYNNDDHNNSNLFILNNSNLSEYEQLELTKEAEMKCLNKFCCTTSDSNPLSLLTQLKCKQMTYLQCLSIDNECIWKCDNNINNNYNNLTFLNKFVGINDRLNAIEPVEIPQSLLKDDNKTINEIDPNLQYVTMDECGTIYEHSLNINSINHEIELIKDIYSNNIIESTKESQESKENDINKRRLGILGNDDRVEIKEWIYPYHRNVYLQKQTSPTHIGRCSGAFITPRHILTAGHCVSDGYGHFYSKFMIIANLNGGGKDKWYFDYQDIFVFNQWFYNKDWNYDIAIITLKESQYDFGYYSFGHNINIQSTDLFDVSGYPSDKEWTMVRMDTYFDLAIQENTLLTQTGDVVKGNSGGPSALVYNGIIYAVVSHEVSISFVDQPDLPPMPIANGFCRITKPKYDSMCTYIQGFTDTANWCTIYH